MSTKASKKPAKRGRPSNATIAARANTKRNSFINIVASAASEAAATAVRDALSDPSAVTTLGIPQGSQSSTPSSAPRARLTPGRRVDPNSKMSLARAFYEKHVNSMERSVMVEALHKKLDISKQVANTYVSNIDKQAGGKLSRRPRKAA
jgi:hypothetical protein